MLLAIDVGNTNIVIGVFDGESLRKSWRLQTLRERTVDELGLLVHGLFAHDRVDRTQVSDIVLASVVPPLTSTTVAMAERFIRGRILVVDPANAGMPVLVANPAEVGADRVVNAVAAYERYGKAGGKPLIVCDFGTATTLDAVTANGEYLGGAICPGVSISADALFARAARLPRIEVRRPARVVGTSTVAAMESGLFWGYVGMVEGLVHRMREELGGEVTCVATGGLAGVIAPEIPAIGFVDPDLTLEGLRLVWARNR